MMASIGAIAMGASLALSACGGAKPGGGEGGSASAWAVTGGTHEQIWRTSFDKWNEAHADAQINV